MARGFGVQGLGFRVWGSEFRDSGLGLRVPKGRHRWLRGGSPRSKAPHSTWGSEIWVPSRIRSPGYLHHVPGRLGETAGASGGLGLGLGLDFKVSDLGP